MKIIRFIFFPLKWPVLIYSVFVSRLFKFSAIRMFTIFLKNPARFSIIVTDLLCTNGTREEVIENSYLGDDYSREKSLNFPLTLTDKLTEEKGIESELHRSDSELLSERRLGIEGLHDVYR